jgi:hypothetical protein
MRELPSFEWGNRSDDGVKRVKRPILMLENGAKYEGEWYLLCSSNSLSYRIQDSDVRDGKGV